jgi:hypothetical protein
MKKILIKNITPKFDFQDFLNVPSTVNRQNPNWIAPLQMSVTDVFSDKNPFWRFCKKQLWVVYDEQGNAIGRIAAFYNEKWNENKIKREGHFGFLETIDDVNIFQALIKTAENWLQQFGCQQIIGPFNPSLNYELGVLIEGLWFPEIDCLKKSI